METDTIKSEIVKILCNKFNRKMTKLNGECMDAPLTGEPLFLSDVEMVYLLLEIEKKFAICIENEYLKEYGFSTVNKIAEVVARCKR